MAFIKEFSKNSCFELSVVDSVAFENEKVSSTRCRNALLKADFKSVEYMLDRPFSLDTSEYEWNCRTENGRKILSSAVRGIQILPPEGLYKVLVIVKTRTEIISQKSGEAISSVNVRAYRSDCTLEKGNLRLSLSDELISGFVLAVQFGYPDENKLIKE